MIIDRERTKYDAPYRKGYIHIGNSVEEDGNRALNSYGKKDGMIAVPFYPDGRPDDNHDALKVKWAIYQWKGL